MSSDTPKPSILATAETLVDEAAIDGLAAGVVVKDGAVGAEIAARKRVGKGFELGAVARWTHAKGVAAAAAVRWTPNRD